MVMRRRPPRVTGYRVLCWLLDALSDKSQEGATEQALDLKTEKAEAIAASDVRLSLKRTLREARAT